jgi:hypothetical protein|tara:strand:+ start:4292 stop:4531 length:240 start_codon:yes stop_codon:yes gene_type:complete
MFKFNDHGSAVAGSILVRTARVRPDSHWGGLVVFDNTVKNYCRPVSVLRAVLAGTWGGQRKQPPIRPQAAASGLGRIAA